MIRRTHTIVISVVIISLFNSLVYSDFNVGDARNIDDHQHDDDAGSAQQLPTKPTYKLFHGIIESSSSLDKQGREIDRKHHERRKLSSVFSSLISPTPQLRSTNQTSESSFTKQNSTNVTSTLLTPVLTNVTSTLPTPVLTNVTSTLPTPVLTNVTSGTNVNVVNATRDISLANTTIALNTTAVSNVTIRTNLTVPNATRTTTTRCGKFARFNSTRNSCQCLPGYTGNRPATTGCQDIDECAARSGNPCGWDNFCTNTPGSFTCACGEVYKGTWPNCVISCYSPWGSPCGPDLICTDVPTGIECTIPDGGLDYCPTICGYGEVCLLNSTENRHTCQCENGFFRPETFRPCIPQ